MGGVHPYLVTGHAHIEEPAYNYFMGTDPLEQIPVALSERIRIRRLSDEVRRTRTGVMYALNMMLDLKDLRTGFHATRLAEWAVRVAEHVGVEGAELEDIERASLLHDIGKIGVPDEILLKPGKLTPDEKLLAEKHPEYGWAILRPIPGFESTSLLVLHHHERWDGGGYPAGLRNEEIPLGSRIVAIVDAYDAMVSDRAYRKGLPREEAIRRLRSDSGKQFDPSLVEIFISLVRSHEAEAEESMERSIPTFAIAP